MKNPTIAQVVLGLPVEGPFDYFIPDEWQEKIKVGARVEVPFGPRRRIGYVVGLLQDSSVKKIKALNRLIDENPILDEGFLKFAKVFSGHYGCSLGEAIDNALPASLRVGRKVELKHDGSPLKSVQKIQSTLLLADNIQSALVFLRERIKTILDQKRGILLVVPETVYLHPIKEFLKKEFPQATAAFQENLSPKEHGEQWVALKEGHARIAAGVISNIFAPVKNLGLIVVFDEESPLYKHEQSPFYHVRDVAFMRQGTQSCDITFVSPAPSAEIFHRAQQENWPIENLRADKSARVQFIDLANFKSRGRGFVSLPLKAMIEKTLMLGGRVILFLNRRGFSSFTVCQFCGFFLKCPRCSTPLMFSADTKCLSCRHCAHEENLPRECPQCGKNYLKSMGAGIEKLQSEMAQAFPTVRVGCIDKTTDSFPQNARVLIATQAVFKWKESIKADLVAVLDMDAEFNHRDFRSSHRAFTLGVRLSALAKEMLVIQTHDCDNYALKAVQLKDYDSFYKKELALRRELNLPPFEHLLMLSLRSRVENTVRQYAQELYNHLAQARGEKLEFHEPQPDVPSKLRDQFRYAIVGHGQHVEAMVAFVKERLKSFKRKGGVVVTLNVDP